MSGDFGYQLAEVLPNIEESVSWGRPGLVVVKPQTTRPTNQVTAEADWARGWPAFRE